MDKKLIALAVAGALAATAAAHAETTLYGSARAGVTYTDPDKGKSNWDVKNESSRLGVKGSEDLGGGLKAIYTYEFGVNIDGNSSGNPFNQRLSYLGLTGGFGTVQLGRMWSAPYLFVGRLTDVFNSSSALDTSIGWNRLSSLTNDNTGTSGGGDRVSDVLAYITPNFSGFQAAGAVVMNGNGQNSSTNREDIDAYDIAAGYTLGGFEVGASYRDFKALDYTQWTAGAGYKFADFRVAATYSARDNGSDNVNGSEVDPSVWDVIGEYTFGNNVVRAGYSSYDHDTKADDTDVWKLGYQYNLSKRTRLWVEYADQTNAGADKATQYDTSWLSIGMRHDF
ncbi:porin [Plasticicumulans acidivorans]|uniref:Putative porin n=1 Tax=Plasticicumulans acidivorans TaxID=886464 RepID=A0A317MYS6_9GAMM|nr:porin [Plasticicumulans acidivorans]PWV64512.1 putative porin [Plasticicumulans acidivorans]